MKPANLIDEDHSQVDVDDGTGCGDLGVADYLDDLYSFYRNVEVFCCPRQYLPDMQPYFDAAARCDTVEWMILMHQAIELSPETLFLATYVLDRYLSVRTVEHQDLSVVGFAAMLGASKYDNISCPTAYDYEWVSGCPRDYIVKTEKDILDSLGWNLSFPTPYVFLIALLRAVGDLHDEEMKNMVFFFAELALTQYQLIVVCPPSILAASAVYAARCTLGSKKPLWPEALWLESRYEDRQFLHCAQCLLELHAAAAR